MTNVLCIYNILTNSISACRIINNDTNKEEAMDKIFHYMFACKQNGNIVMDVMIDYNNIDNFSLAKECKEQLKFLLLEGD